MENYRYLESLDEEFFFTNYQFHLPIYPRMEDGLTNEERLCL
jgi:hypothetical protein